MHSDWLIGVIYAAANCPAGICGGFLCFPEWGLHKNIFGWFYRVPGDRDENPLGLSLVLSATHSKNNNTHLFFCSRASWQRPSGATFGGQVSPSNTIFEYISFVRATLPNIIVITFACSKCWNKTKTGASYRAEPVVCSPEELENRSGKNKMSDETDKIQPWKESKKTRWKCNPRAHFVYNEHWHGKTLIVTRSTIEVTQSHKLVFWMTGFLNPKSSKCQSCFEKWCFSIPGSWDYSSGCNLIFAGFSFRVRYGAPQVRSLRKSRVNPYHRTPRMAPYVYNEH